MTASEYTQLVEFLGQQFTAIDGRFAAVDGRFDALERHLTGLREEILGHFDAIYRWLGPESGAAEISSSGTSPS